MGGTVCAMNKKIKSYMNQVGGHCCLLTRESSHGDLIILKPAVKREVDFYQDHLPKLAGLQRFVPTYFGLEVPGSPPGMGSMGTARQKLPYITMENLTADYIRPCVLDLKMGTRQHGHDAGPKKVLPAALYLTLLLKKRTASSDCGHLSCASNELPR